LHYRLPIDFVESITGANKRLTLPDGGTLDVKIPPGLVDRQILRLRGKGAPGTGKGGPGDALIEVEVLPDRRFTREGDDISLEMPISLSEAVLGGRVRVPTPTGNVTMSVPKGSNTGTTMRLKGKGAPRRGGGHGDQFVKLKVVLPKFPDPELEAFVSNWDKGKAFNPREDGTS
jgi:DnaJ-class molecular chaperone